jgi:enoyl-CoA hydratase/carnithine racemase
MKTPHGSLGMCKPEYCQITLNRPQALNTLNVELLNSLCDALRENAKEQVIVLEGASDRSFCAGEDLKQALAPKADSAEEFPTLL